MPYYCVALAHLQPQVIFWSVPIYRRMYKMNFKSNKGTDNALLQANVAVQNLIEFSTFSLELRHLAFSHECLMVTLLVDGGR